MNKKITVTTISILLVIFILIKFNKDIISVYILCGGKNKRMGTEKGLVKINGKSFIELIVNVVSDFSKNSWYTIGVEGKTDQPSSSVYVGHNLHPRILIFSFNLKPAWSDAKIILCLFIFLFLVTGKIKI